MRRMLLANPPGAAEYGITDVDRDIDPMNGNTRIIEHFPCYTLNRLVEAASQDPRIKAYYPYSSHEVFGLSRTPWPFSNDCPVVVVVSPERYRVYSSNPADPSIDMSGHNELVRRYEFIGTGDIPRTLDLIVSALPPMVNGEVDRTPTVAG